MKKIPFLLMALLVLFAPACDDDDNSISILRGTLIVDYDFTGATLSTDDDATKRVYVYLYNVLSLFPYQYFAVEGTSDVVAIPGDLDGEITMSNVFAGKYYAMVFYDSNHDGDHVASQSDPYMIYHSGIAGNQTANPYAAITNGGDSGNVTINPNETTTITMTYGGSAVFGTDGAWDF
jgi:hypothetical protein